MSASQGVPRGRWTDGATGEHGDLLDLIRLAKGLSSVAEALKEAREFLHMPSSLAPSPKAHPTPRSDDDAVAQARRVFSWSKPLRSTLAETYLNGREIVIRENYRALRFHPSCYVQNEATHATEQWPALIAAITDGDGSITAIQRTYLNRDGQGKAPFENPRRSLGLIQGHGIRLGWTKTKTCLSVGEGLESMLSLRQLLPGMPAIAATSAAHVALFHIPRHVQRLYIAADGDEAGDHAAEVLTKRVEEDANCHVLRLRAVGKDFNDDLCQLPAGRRLQAWPSSWRRKTSNTSGARAPAPSLRGRVRHCVPHGAVSKLPGTLWKKVWNVIPYPQLNNVPNPFDFRRRPLPDHNPTT